MMTREYGKGYDEGYEKGWKDAMDEKPTEALAQPEQCQCPNCKVTLHASDCAVHSGPAYPAGGCDCGAQQGPEFLMDSEGYPHTCPRPTPQEDFA